MSGRAWVIVGAGGFWMLVAGVLVVSPALIGLGLAMMLGAAIAIVLKERDR